MTQDNIKSLLEFYDTVNKLKFTYRFSATPSMPKESTAAHSWRLSLMTFTLSKELELDIDTTKAIKIAIIHDIGEYLYGDVDNLLIVNGTVSKEDKKRQESEAFKKLCEILPQDYAGEISNLWNEYEYAKSPEAKYIKALDKIECMSHGICVNVTKFKERSHLARYADNAVKEFPKLLPVLKSVKEKLKIEFMNADIPWLDEYNYGLI